MLEYPPLLEHTHALLQAFSLSEHLQSIPAFADLHEEMVEAILREAQKIHAEQLHPLNAIGDQQGCRLIGGKVYTPSGFIEAYQAYVQGGWPGFSANPQYGGQGMPHMLGLLIEEMLCASGLSFHLYPNLTQGVARAIGAHANESLKNTFLPKLISGEWCGCMCLTEPQAGSDLSAIQTLATPEGELFSLEGQKIFITGGAQDLTENIIHLVLARTPNAPAGLKGLSLFLVPWYWVEGGTLGESNGIVCTGIEHKMGLQGSSTCSIAYEKAKGFLVGELHQGLAAMFTVMNIERIAIGIQGLGAAAITHHNARRYAHERQQGGKSIANYPTMQRRLNTLQAYEIGCRSWLIWLGQHIDRSKHLQEITAKAVVDYLTPVVKAFFTDWGLHASQEALQVFGGYGYVRETGMEQWVRDVRVAQIYEGTNDIQALDLVKRKLHRSDGFAHCSDALTSLTQATEFLARHQKFVTATERFKQQPEEFQWAHALEYLHATAHWVLSALLSHLKEKAPAFSTTAEHFYRESEAHWGMWMKILSTTKA